MRTDIYNVAIIGGGVIGCALARELGKRFSNVLLLEKESAVGCHTSGRNSGVVHSGFNPKPGTLKARLCVEGSKLVRDFCANHKVPFEQVGTIVVAVEKAEIPALYELKASGEKNGVPGLQILSEKVLREHEPNAKGIAALYSPTGAIVDSRSLTRALAEDAQESGINIAVGQEVRRIVERPGAVQVSTEKDTYTARLVVNCAGLHADRLAHSMGLGKEYVIAPFRGEYFVVRRPSPPIIRSMVYPVPNPLVPFLGIHLTRTISGSVLVGPNAVPAFGREAYRRGAINLRDMLEMLSHRGPWNAVMRNRSLVGIAWNELLNSCSKRHFLHEASKLVSGLTVEDLELGTRVGIRPQLVKSDGHLVEDLVIETSPRSVHLLNVVSPGMTSSLAFAGWLSSHINNNLTWTGPKAATVN